MARMPDSHPDAGSSSPFHRDDDEEQRQPSIPRGKRSIASQTSRPDRRKRGKHTSSFRSDEAHYGGSPVLRPLTPLTRPAYSAVTENQSRGSRNSLEHHANHHQNGSPGPSRVPPRAPTPPPPPVADRLPRDRRSGHNFTSIGSWCDNNPTPPRTRRPEHITLSESRNDGMISPSPEPETYGSSNESSFMASSYQFDYAGEDDDDRISNSACYITMVDRYNAARQSAAEEHINATRRAAGRR